jgi:NDP-sugar pyrophosphorylase family protein
LATRLLPLTEAIPKSLVNVAGHPFIEHQLRLLARQGFHDVVICAGHLGEQIEAFIGDGSAFDCHCLYSFDGGTPLGTGGALKRALPLLGDGFLVMYGDSYLSEPLQPVWNSFLESGKPALMTVFRNDDRWGASNVEFEAGRVVRYDKSSPTHAMRYIDYGLSCIRSAELEAYESGDAFDLSAFYAELSKRGVLGGFEVKERFYEIGSPAGLAETEALLAGTER